MEANCTTCLGACRVCEDCERAMYFLEDDGECEFCGGASILCPDCDGLGVEI